MNATYLARQLLLERSKITPVAAVERLVGLQAQLAKPPYMGLWTRVAGITREGLNKLFLDKKLVRGTAMRGTLHVMTAGDFLSLRASLQPGLTAGMNTILREKAKGLPLEAAAAFARTKMPCTFDELRDALAVEFPRYEKRALAFALRMTLPVIQVPEEGERFGFSGDAKFQAADTWLGAELGPADPAELVRRYLRGYGPATVRDAQVWSGLPALAPAFAGLKGVEKLYDVDGAPAAGKGVPPPRLIPAFDNLILSHHDRERIVDTAHRSKITSKNLQVAPTFLIAGRVAGTWKYDKGQLVLAPFGKLAKADAAALEAEAEAAADVLA